MTTFVVLHVSSLCCERAQYEQARRLAIRAVAPQHNENEISESAEGEDGIPMYRIPQDGVRVGTPWKYEVGLTFPVQALLAEETSLEREIPRTPPTR